MSTIFNGPLFNFPLIKDHVENDHYVHKAHVQDDHYVHDDYDEITCSMLFTALIDRIIEVASHVFNSIKESIISCASSCKKFFLKALWLFKTPDDNTIKPQGPLLSQEMVRKIEVNKNKFKAEGTITFQEATLNRRSIILIDVAASLRNSRHEIPIRSRFFVDKEMIPRNIQLQDALSFIFKAAAFGGLQDGLSRRLKGVSIKGAPQVRLRLSDLQHYSSIDDATLKSWNEYYSLARPHMVGSFILLGQSSDGSQETASVDYYELEEVKDHTQINLHPYLNSISLLNGFNLDDNIQFNDGAISKVTGPAVKGQKKLFYNFLKATYGSSLADQIGKRYNLNEDTALTFKQFKEALSGIAARVTINDVKKLFNEIQNSSRFMLCQFLLSDEDRNIIKETIDFQDLSYAMILKLVNCFRRVPQASMQVLMQEALWGEFIYDKNELKHELKLSVNCRHDLEILMANEHLFQLDESELAFAVSEHSAKRLAYASVDVGMIFPLVDSLSGLALYEVRSKLKDLNDGMVAHFMTPIRTYRDSGFGCGGSLPIVLNFRGTQTSSERLNAGQSLVRDLDPFGVGSTSFDSRKKEILDHILAIIKTKKDNFSGFHLNINGHSLGGADVQRALALVVSEIARKGHDPLFDCIDKITACAHNSPGVEFEVNRQFSEDVKRVKCSIDLSYVFFDSDPVQVAGSVYLGAQASSRNLNKKIIHLTSDQLKYLKVHSAQGFAGSKQQFSRISLDHTQDSDVIEQRLGKWDHWNSTTGRVSHQLFSKALFVPQAALWYAFRFGHTIYRVLT